MLKLVETLDAKLTRSVFVSTKFHFQLANFTSVGDLTAWLGGRPQKKVKTFFVSLFSEECYKKNITPAKFQEKITQAEKRDALIMDKLKFDHRHENLVGVSRMRKYILEQTWKKYDSSIPDLRKQIRALEKERQDQLSNIENQLRTLDNKKLRSMSANYVSEYLQLVISLLQGSVEGGASLKGQTLEDEKTLLGEWLDEDGNAIKFDPQQWNLRNCDAKLFGGEQIVRLLAQFKSVADHTTIKNLTVDEIATSSGLSGLRNVSTHIWAASDIARRKCLSTFVPLMRQFMQRLVYITKRITDIVENIMEIERKSKRSGPKEFDILRDYPQFTWHVRDLFDNFIDDLGKNCLDKCIDELVCTQLLYWEQTSKAQVLKQVPSFSAAKRNNDTTKASVETLATEIFYEQQVRITHNVLLKAYDYFMVRL